MSTDNFWGALPLQEELRAPVVILKEQASKLGELTNMSLIGNVQITREYASISMILSIIVPSLDNYEYEVLKATHEALIYPVKVYDLNDTLGASPRWEPIKCEDEADFIKVVTDILSSETIHKVIASLLAQTRI
jgi:hypothetical protein